MLTPVRFRPAGRDWRRGRSRPGRCQRRRRSGSSRSRSSPRARRDRRPGSRSRRLCGRRVRRPSGQPIIVTLRPAIFDRDVLPLDIAGFAQSLAERGRPIRTLMAGRAAPRKPITGIAFCCARRRQKATGRCAGNADNQDVSPIHSMTSSARASSDLRHRQAERLCGLQVDRPARVWSVAGPADRRAWRLNSLTGKAARIQRRNAAAAQPLGQSTCAPFPSPSPRYRPKSKRQPGGSDLPWPQGPGERGRREREVNVRPERWLWAGTLCVALMAAVPATAEEAPKYGGTLTYMIPADAPPSFDAHRETTYATIHSAAPFYSMLIRVNPMNPGFDHRHRVRPVHRDAEADRRRQDLHLQDPRRRQVPQRRQADRRGRRGEPQQDRLPAAGRAEPARQHFR